MSDKRRGLGKGLGALIPTTPAQGRPVDVFFPDQRGAGRTSPGESARTGRKSTDPAAGLTARPEAGTVPVPLSAKDTTGRRSTEPANETSATQGTAPRHAPAGRSELSADSGSDSDAEVGAERPEGDSGGSGTGTPAAGTDASAEESELLPVPGASFAELLVDEVVANRRQPRQVFDEEELEELAASIREVGVLQPIVVRPLPPGERAAYELIMGERRWRASQVAGSTTIPAIIRQVDDTDLLRDALLENLHRAQLNPLEEAAAYQQLLEDFDCTHEELAARVIRSRPQISNTLRLLKLPPLVQRRVAAGILSAGHSRALLGLSDPAAMERLAQRIVAEGLSVRTTEEIVALGDEPTAPELRRRPRVGAHAAELNELATRLADRFDTRVKIGMGQRKGKINIEFASLEDLNRILAVLAPTVERPLSSSP